MLLVIMAQTVGLTVGSEDGFRERELLCAFAFPQISELLPEQVQNGSDLG